MTSDEKDRPPRRGPADNTTTAASSIDDGADEEQLTLWAYAIPTHRLADAEWDLRRFVNSQPRKKRGWAA
jgi:hypothetical protein